MKPIFLGLCLLSAGTVALALAQPQTPNALADTGGVALSAQPQTVSLAQLAKARATGIAESARAARWCQTSDGRCVG